MMTKEELTKKRLKLNLSKEAMGKLLGVNRSTVWRWESGESRIPKMVELILGEKK